MGRTILVADDSPTIQKKASGILTGEGLDVVTVSNGVAAVKKLPAVNPLVVLADVSMPGKDGYEVCEHIKSNASLAHVSVLLVYSDTDPYEEAKGARVGADGRIKKPFERDELVGTVNKFLAQSEAALTPKKAPPPQVPAEYEVQPLDEEPEMAARQEVPDLSAFSEGMAFGVPAAEEVPSVPADATAEPMMSEPMHIADEEALPSGEVVEGASAFVPTEGEPTAEISTPMPAPDVNEPMLVEEAAVETAPEEDAGERTMMFRAPADIAQPVLSDEVEVEPPAEPAMVEAESPEPRTFGALETAPPVEEVQPAEETVLPEPPPAESSAAEEPADITPPEGTSVATQTLSGFSLSDAAAGRIRFGQPETEVIHEPDRTVAPPPEPVISAPEPPARVAHEPEVMIEEPAVAEVAAREPEPTAVAEVAPPQEAEEPAAPPEAAAPPAEQVEPPKEAEEPAAVAEEAAAPPPAEGAPAEKTIDEAQVSSIVHKVVVKMSPPALSQQTVEDLARQLADEIIAELKSES